jgi:hypothetical protein
MIVNEMTAIRISKMKRHAVNQLTSYFLSDDAAMPEYSSMYWIWR